MTRALFALLLVSTVALASPGVSPPPPSHPQEPWIGECLALVQKARDRLGVAPPFDDDVILGTVTNAMQPDRFQTFWQPRGSYIVTLSFAQRLPAGEVQDEEWHEETVGTRKAGKTLRRYFFRAGRSLRAEIAIVPDVARGAEFVDLMRGAVDGCVARMPRGKKK